MVLLTLSASIDSLRPPQCKARPCPQATGGQTWLLYGALALIALGTGGIKPCVSTFGADQFDEADKKEVPKKYVFFNLFFLAINRGVLFVAGIRFYRFQKPMGSPFTRFAQVLWASVRNHLNGVRAGHQTEPYEVNTNESDIKGAQNFLDKAAVVADPEADTRNRWRLCTVTQVEEFKSFARILPAWASTIALSISFAQLSTFFISQANIMDRKLGQLECFYDEATDGTRSISSAMFLSEIGIGINLAVYVWIAVLYKGRDGVVGSVRSESVFEIGDGG
ncbi:hypothetical protein DKX38_008542 [Salix brachista]|uniref:Uncharacterized protein n=1 Tax=Salix brachista TaxID=2182728 RepID=A0A5N5MSU3_9ROSI|nr:hypothetical protein DKX38_008542 [Salix brachista]